MLRLTTAACVAVCAAGTAWAQVPVLTRNADEPGRVPYQEAQLTSCTDPGDCQVVFAAVPASSRRVIDYVNCEVDVSLNGALIGVNLGSQANRLPRAALPFTTNPALTTRSIVNSITRLYYDVNEHPTVDAYTTGTGVPFLMCTLTGYNISSP